MERKIFGQTTKEMRFWECKNNRGIVFFLGTREGPQQNHHGEAENGTRLKTKGLPGRLSSVYIMELSCLH